MRVSTIDTDDECMYLHTRGIEHYTPYSARRSPENTHKLIGFYKEGFNTRRYTLVHGFCFFKLFSIGCVGLTTTTEVCACKSTSGCTSVCVCATFKLNTHIHVTVF